MKKIYVVGNSSEFAGGVRRGNHRGSSEFACSSELAGVHRSSQEFVGVRISRDEYAVTKALIGRPRLKVLGCFRHPMLGDAQRTFVAIKQSIAKVHVRAIKLHWWFLKKHKNGNATNVANCYGTIKARVPRRTGINKVGTRASSPFVPCCLPVIHLIKINWKSRKLKSEAGKPGYMYPCSPLLTQFAMLGTCRFLI